MKKKPAGDKINNNNNDFLFTLAEELTRRTRLNLVGFEFKKKKIIKAFYEICDIIL